MINVKYLISAATKCHAKIIAEGLGVRLGKEAVFVPWEPDYERDKKIMGRKGFTEEQLVGYFLDEEKEYLTRC